MRNGNGEDEGSGSSIDFATARGRDYPSVRQFNVFVENRVGGLLAVVRRFESTDIRIVALTVNDSADYAIIRMVLSDPEAAKEIFDLAGLPITESDLLVVELPPGTQPLVDICKAFLGGDQHPLRLPPHDRPARQVGLAPVEDHETASQTLSRLGFNLLTEKDLQDDDELH